MNLKGDNAPLSVTNGDRDPSGAPEHPGTLAGPIPDGETDGGWTVENLGSRVSEMLGGLEKRRQANLRRVVQAQMSASMCGVCGKPFGAGEVIWRGAAPAPPASERRPDLVPMCDSCRYKAKDGGFDSIWAEPEPCEACGRPVRNLRKRPARRRYITCSERCRRRVQKARESDFRALARLKVCATCRDPFEGSRSDARYCSPACRQKAYRQRGKKG